MAGSIFGGDIMNSMLKCMALAAVSLTAVAAQAGPITSDTLGPQVTLDTASWGYGAGTISGNGMTLSGGYNQPIGFGLSYLDAFGPIRLDFATPTTGFGFQFLLNNVDLSVSAYDSSNNLLESDIFSIAGLPTDNFGYPRGYAGIDGLSGISYAIITTQLGSGSVYVGPVNAELSAPEPASWALMVGGFGLVGGAMRSRKRTAVTFA